MDECKERTRQIKVAVRTNKYLMPEITSTAPHSSRDEASFQKDAFESSKAPALSGTWASAAMKSPVYLIFFIMKTKYRYTNDVWIFPHFINCKKLKTFGSMTFYDLWVNWGP